MSRLLKAKSAWIILLLTAFALEPALTQQARGKNSMLLDPSRPSVYLQYDHEGVRQPVYAGESRSGMWLHIHNNTREAICIRTESLYIGSKVAPLTLASGRHVLGIRDGVEVAPLYSIEQSEDRGFERLPLTFQGDVFAVSWIPSGGTVLMSLPKDNLSKGRRVALPFSYEWEPEGDAIAHEAFFYSRELPREGSSAISRDH
jgi:hypothetical protein